jgi:hypothetical protein
MDKKTDWRYLCGESCGEKRMPGYYKHGGNLPGMMPNPIFLPDGKERYVLLHLGYAAANFHHENAEGHLNLDKYQLVTLCQNDNHVLGHVVEYRRQFYGTYLVVKVYAEVLVLTEESQRKALFAKIKKEALESMHDTQFEISSCA